MNKKLYWIAILPFLLASCAGVKKDKIKNLGSVRVSPITAKENAYTPPSGHNLDGILQQLAAIGASALSGNGDALGSLTNILIKEGYGTLKNMSFKRGHKTEIARINIKMPSANYMQKQIRATLIEALKNSGDTDLPFSYSPTAKGRIKGKLLYYGLTKTQKGGQHFTPVTAVHFTLLDAEGKILRDGYYRGLGGGRGTEFPAQRLDTYAIDEQILMERTQQSILDAVFAFTYDIKEFIK